MDEARDKHLQQNFKAKTDFKHLSMRRKGILFIILLNMQNTVAILLMFPSFR